MAIIFDNPNRGYGIASAGTLLAEALGDILGEKRQIAQEGRLQQRKIADEQRAQQLKQKLGSLLGPALSIAQDEQRSYGDRLGSLQQYISQTGDTSVLPLMKMLQEQQREQSVLGQFGFRPQAGGASPGMQAQMEQMTTQMPAEEGAPPAFSRFSDEQLTAMAANPNRNIQNAAKAEMQRREFELKKSEAGRREFESERKYHSEVANAIEKRMDDIRESLPRKRSAVNTLSRALASGNLSFFSPDKLADITGIEQFRTAEGAQLRGAVKEFLLSGIASLSGRPNQWLEQQMNSYLPQIGQSQEAQLASSQLLQGEIDLDAKKLEIFDRLRQEDMDRYGYVRKDISARANKELRPYEDKLKNNLAYRMREIYEDNRSLSDLRESLTKKVPDGTPLTPKMFRLLVQRYGSEEKAFDNADKLGYTIMSKEDRQ